MPHSEINDQESRAPTPPPPRVLITAGPTHEPIDSVRYLANRSSGRMGIALAEAGRAAGWDVTLLLGPAPVISPLEGMRVERFRSTADLAALLDEYFPVCDLLVMAAAVSDYRSARAGGGKLPRSAGGLTLDLEPTPDLVARCADRRRSNQRIVGFALESPDRLLDRAAEKLKRKRLDAIVANPLATMGDDAIDATILTPDGRRHTPGPMPKAEFARWLVAWLTAEGEGKTEG